MGEKTIKSQSKMRHYVTDAFRVNYDNTFRKKCSCDGGTRGKCTENCKCQKNEEEGD